MMVLVGASSEAAAPCTMRHVPLHATSTCMCKGMPVHASAYIYIHKALPCMEHVVLVRGVLRLMLMPVHDPLHPSLACNLPPAPPPTHTPLHAPRPIPPGSELSKLEAAYLAQVRKNFVIEAACLDMDEEVASLEEQLQQEIQRDTQLQVREGRREVEGGRREGGEGGCARGGKQAVRVSCHVLWCRLGSVCERVRVRVWSGEGVYVCAACVWNSSSRGGGVLL